MLIIFVYKFEKAARKAHAALQKSYEMLMIKLKLLINLLL